MADDEENGRPEVGAAKEAEAWRTTRRTGGRRWARPRRSRRGGRRRSRPRRAARDEDATVCLGSTNKLCLGQRLKHVTPLEMT